MLTQEILKTLLRYEPDTGNFFWIKERPGRKIGIPAGTTETKGRHKGRRRISVNGRAYYAHRLAWLYITGNWPKNEIDHRDRDQSNNRWANLREATSTENSFNKRRTVRNTTGIKGVSFNSATQKFVSSIKAGGKQFNLGYFATKEEAAEAYRQAAARLHGEFASYE